MNSREAKKDSLKIGALIQELKKNQIHLWLDDDLLKYKSPPNKMTFDVLQTIKSHKTEIVSFLKGFRPSSSFTLPELIKLEVTTDSFHASSVQKRLWYIDKLNSGSENYNISVEVAVKGSIDVNKMKHTCEQLVSQHESLRTSFHEESGDVVQKIHPNCLIDMEIFENPDFLPYEEPLIFDLSCAPLVKFQLVLNATDSASLYITCHHIVCDGRSMEILFNDFCDLYSGTFDFADQYQFKDYSEACQTFTTSGDAKNQLAYWESKLSGDLPVLELPLQIKHPIEQTYNGENLYLDLDDTVSESLKDIVINNNGVTPFGIFLSIYIMLLHRYSNQNDIVVGIPVNNRFSDDLYKTVGMFVNSLPIRQKFTPETTAIDVINNVAEQIVLANQNGLIALDKIIEQLNIERNPGHSPIFQTMFMMDSKLPDKIINDTCFSFVTHDSKTAKFDISLSVNDLDGCYFCAFEYNTDLFDHVLISQIANHYKALSNLVLINPDERVARYDILSQQEKHELIYSGNNTQVNYDKHIKIHQLFESMAMIHPDQIAVECDGELLTYKELNQKANILAHYLMVLGVRPEKTVAVLLDRSMEAVITLLAILKANGVFVPLDPAYPTERIKYILHDADCQIVISKSNLSEEIDNVTCKVINLDTEYEEPVGINTSNPVCKTTMDDLAYIIYTSGSTGNPKGVMIHHLGITHYIQWACKYYRVNAGVGAPVHSSLAFDLTITSIFAPLATGKTIFMIPEKYGLEGLIAALSDRQDYSLIKLTPAHLRLLQTKLNKDVMMNLHASIVIGGEALFADDLKYWHQSGKNMRFINEYGATETSVADTIYELGEHIPETASIPVGKAIDNSEIYVLDNYLSAVPYGVIGEIYLSGVGLSRGYLNQPEKTQEKFIPHPFIEDEMIYKTGDFGRIWPDGNVEFVARLDDQVKIKGYRIELGEVQQAIDSHTDINKTVVIVRKHESNDNYLAAYYMAITNSLCAHDLRDFLRKKLPTYMIPSCFIKLDELPLTVNGKVDVKNLPKPNASDFVIQSGYQAPTNSKEQLLVEVWQKLLNIDAVSINDSFYALGGDSISSISLVSTLRQLGWDLTIQDILHNQTVKELATVLNKSAQVDAQQAVIVDGVCQFSPIQRWFIDQNFSNPNYFNQSYFFKLLNEVKYEDLNEAFGAIQEMHDEFWLRLDRDGGQFYLKQADRCCIQVERYSCPKQTLDQQIKWVEVKVNTAQAELNLGSGPLTKMLLFGDCVDGKQRVAWIIHHWMVDTVSWNILIDDISMLLQGKQLAPKSASYADWTKTINYQKMLLTEDDNNYWKALLDKTEPFLKTKLTNRQKADYRQISVSLDSILSEKMLKISVNKTAIALDRLVMNAVFTTLADILKKNEFLIDVESHGRDLTDELNIIRTVGWFTNMYPIKFKKTNNCIDTLKGIESSISRTPKLGSGYGMWRYLCAIEGLVNNIEVGFNFLGDQSSSRHDILETSGEIDLHEIDNANYPWHMLDVNSWVQDGVIRIRISFHPELLTDVESNSLIPSITDNLNDLAESLNKKNLCNELSTEVVGKNKLQSQKQGYSLPATTTQHLMYCCSTKIDKSEYTTQIILDCSDNDIDIFETWENIFKQHPVLASSFIMNSDHQLLQIIGQFKNFERYAYDWSGFSDDDIKQKIEGFLDCDMQKGFDFITPSPLMRIAVLKLAGGNNKCIWTHHHILIDGWSMAKILESWYSLLSGSGNIESKEAELERYAQWRYNQEQNDDVIYWNNRLKKIRSRNLVRKQLPSKTSFHSFKKNIGRELTEKISNLCSQSSITPNILFQCSWELICSAYTGNHTVIHDVITSGRTANFSGVEDVIGLTMNILPYVTKLDVSKDVVEFLKSSQEQFYQDMAHDNITWNKIFDADLQKRMSISDSLFVYENYQADKIGGVNKIDCRSKTHYPIVIAILPGESTTVAFDYKSEYFSKKQVELFANIMVKTLNSVVCHGEHKEVGDLLEDIVMLASESNTATRTLLVNFSIRQEKRDKNIFLIHPGSSGAEAYSDFHKKLLMDFNVLAIDSYNKSTSYWPLITIKQMAKKYIQVMKSEQKHGPYTILGWSLGGVIAYEMAQQLRLEGESVAQLGLIDSFNFSKNAKMVADYLYKLINLRTQQSEWFKSLSSIEQENLDRLSYVESQAIANYKVKPYNNKVVLYKAQQGRSDVLELGDDQLQCFSDNMLIVKDNGWSGVIDNLEVVNVPAHHYNILQNKTGKEIAEDMTEKARRY